jgi:pantothenate kinase
MLSSVHFGAETIALSPYVIAISGPVGSGKSTFATQLNQHFLKAGIKSALVSTDHFLLPNIELAQKNIRKGFPQSYDLAWLQRFLLQMSVRQPAIYPCYAHQTYNRIPDVQQQLPTDRQVVIIEGLNAINLKAFNMSIYLLARSSDCIHAITTRTLQLLQQHPETQHPLNQKPLDRKKIEQAVIDNWQHINRLSSWVHRPHLVRAVHYLDRTDLYCNDFQLTAAIVMRNLYWQFRLFMMLSLY